MAGPKPTTRRDALRPAPELANRSAKSDGLRITEMRVVAGRHDGIGTRLLTLMAGRYFAQAAGLPVSFIWPSLHDPLYTSNDLLKFGSSGEIFRDARVFKDLDGPPVADWDQDTKFFAVSWLTEPATVDNVLQGAKDVDVVLYNVPHMIVGTEGHESGAGSYSRLWRSFNFSEEVTGAYNQIAVREKRLRRNTHATRRHGQDAGRKSAGLSGKIRFRFIISAIHAVTAGGKFGKSVFGWG